MRICKDVIAKSNRRIRKKYKCTSFRAYMNHLLAVRAYVGTGVAAGQLVDDSWQLFSLPLVSQHLPLPSKPGVHYSAPTCSDCPKASGLVLPQAAACDPRGRGHGDAVNALRHCRARALQAGCRLGRRPHRELGVGT